MNDNTTPLYASPVSDALNVRFVENNIAIDRPAAVVYDWVTTWSNLPKWLPVADRVEVRRGADNIPAALGDELFVQIKSGPVPKIYTVVTRLPGKMWTVAAQNVVGGEREPRISWVAMFTTFDLGNGATLFSRLFQSIRSDDNSTERGAVEDPAVIQAGLELLKERIEAETPRP
ncbi:SRPBCC family protein [Streptomyces sp. NPDC096354]|uniref:SRPBCC family protein n=1 Tax=Streptomyces sp. NPDC096354 TaxID=3366088 RepID=UPI00380CF59A